MALILEIRDRRGTTTWHPLKQLPLTVGRGLSNDIILDDPYVDARHARIAPDDSGVLIAHDLGSVNGLLANGIRTGAPIAVQAGTELGIGRTTLRFRDQDEPLPPALVESSPPVPRAVRWAFTPGASPLLILGMTIVTAVVTWLGTTERSTGTAVLGAVVLALVFVTVWGGISAVVVRGADRRIHVRAHTAVISGALALVLLYGMLNDWLVFFFPDVALVAFAYTSVVLLLVAGVVAGHLDVAGLLTQRLRWRRGLSVSAVLLLLILVGALVDDEKFSDVPRFPAQVKPMPPRLVPTRTVKQFVEAIGEARSKADKAIKR